MNTKLEVQIPKADESEVANLPSGQLGSINKKFEKIDQVLFGIMIAVVLSMVAIIVSVTGLFLDQIRYNNSAYKEYSSKIESVDKTQQINQELLDQNQKNQLMIIDLQKQIQELIKNK